MFKKTFFSFAVWIAICFIISLCMRIVEFVSILQYHSLFSGLIQFSIFGWFSDLSILSLLLLILFPVYCFLSAFTKIQNLFFFILFSILILFHVGIVQYYAYMLVPLSDFFWAYFPHELIFTIRTSNSNYTFPIITCIISILILCLCCVFFFRKPFKKYLVYVLFSVFLCCLASNIYTYSFFIKFDETRIPYSILKNKSHYFYKKSAKHFLVKNKIDTLVNYQERTKLFPNRIFFDQEYPLLSITNYEDVLGSYFQRTDENPNIVILIVEGLGERFLNKYKGIELMPFLTDLAGKSLYWKNFVANSERSVGALPSVLASAPYGEKGFVFLNSDTTSLSLMNLLAQYGYFSSFFYGQPSWFHNAGPYLKRIGVNRLEHAYTFPDKYPKIMVHDYFWGYNDQDLVNYTLEVLDSLPQSSRLDVIYTGSMHSPFMISQKEKYANKLDQLVSEHVEDREDTRFFKQYRTYFETILFTDDALHTLFDGYKKLPNYDNTIFIITGDHGMSEIPLENLFQQYHIPFIIYSSRLIEPEIFLSVNSNLDIVPTLLAFLQKQHEISMPKVSAFIGKSLDTCKTFRCLQPIIMIDDDRNIDPILSDQYLMIRNQLYQLDENLTPQSITNDVIKKQLQCMLQNFIALNNYTYMNNRLVPVEVYMQSVFPHKVQKP